MWDKLRAVVREPDHVTRIETSTALGVSDVEYVIGTYHGWLELKRSTAKLSSSKIALSTDYTTQQYQWLLAHHRPQNNLCSFLVIGRMFKAPVVEWFVIPAIHTAMVLLVKDLRWTQIEEFESARGPMTVDALYSYLRYWNRGK